MHSRISVRIFWRYNSDSGLNVQYGANSVVTPLFEKALLFGSSYSLDELESGDGNGGKPSCSRNLLCFIVAFWIVFSIISNWA